MAWYVNTTPAKRGMEICPERCAAHPAAIASNTDFNKMAGNATGIGIPKSKEFITGERIAVSRPTFQPYL